MSQNENQKNISKNPKQTTTIFVSVLVVAIIVFIVKSTNAPQKKSLQASQYNSFTNKNIASNQEKTIEKIKTASSDNRNQKNLVIPFSQHLDTPPINDIKIDNSGRVWLATEKGIYKLENNILTAFTNENGKYPFPQAECIESDGKKIWVGSLYGICSYDKAGKFINETNNFKLPSEIVWDILWDGNNLWIATQKGISFINSNKETNVLNNTNTNNGLRSPWCTKLSRFSSWLAAANDNGLSLWNINLPAANPTAWKNVDHAKSSISRPINDIVFDGKNIWLGTPTGLMTLTTPVENLFNLFSTEMISYTELHGLPDNSINAMVFHKNSIWLGTSKGLARITNNRIQTISSSSSENAEHIRSLYVHGDILWIGTNTGLKFINTAMVE